jgi:hypothetical protein
VRVHVEGEVVHLVEGLAADGEPMCQCFVFQSSSRERRCSE